MASLVLKHNRILKTWKKPNEKINGIRFMKRDGYVLATVRGAKSLIRRRIFTLEKVIEIRIPWQLLNFSNPSQGRIHDDYYQHYGVSEIAIDSIRLGLGEWKREYIRMENYRLEKWNRPTVEGVLKLHTPC